MDRFTRKQANERVIEWHEYIGQPRECLVRMYRNIFQGTGNRNALKLYKIAATGGTASEQPRSTYIGTPRYTYNGTYIAARIGCNNMSVCRLAIALQRRKPYT